LWPFALLLGLLALQLLLFTAVLRVVNTGLDSVPQREVVWQRPLLTNSLNAQLDGTINLLGYELQQTDDSWQITLYWQPDSQLATTYTVFNHLIADDGTLAAQADGMPQNNTLPTTCWLPNEIISDSYTLQIPPNLPAGEYRLLSGMYDPYSGVRLPLTAGSSPYSDAILIEIVPTN
jgi:hypothetical protein